jgi:ECF sigma factor
MSILVFLTVRTQVCRSKRSRSGAPTDSAIPGRRHRRNSPGQTAASAARRSAYRVRASIRTLSGRSAPREDFQTCQIPIVQCQLLNVSPALELAFADNRLALNRLAKDYPAVAELVKLRFFAGMTLGEAADAPSLPRRTADRTWMFARAWLATALAGGKFRSFFGYSGAPPGRTGHW